MDDQRAAFVLNSGVNLRCLVIDALFRLCNIECKAAVMMLCLLDCRLILYVEPLLNLGDRLDGRNLLLLFETSFKESFSFSISVLDEAAHVGTQVASLLRNVKCAPIASVKR